MKEMIKKCRGTLIWSALVMVIVVVVGILSLPNKGINVFFAVIYCVLVAIIFFDNRNRQQSYKVIGMALWIVPVIALLHNIIVRLAYIDTSMDNLYVALTYYGTGVLFVVVGNYLPKVKPNIR